MTDRSSLTRSLLVATLVLTLAGCAKISLGPKQPGGAPSGQATGGQQGGAPVATANPMSGTWKIAFKFNNQVMKATMQLQQQGNQFTGSGTDDDSGRAFDVQGTVNGQDVTFTKQYQAPGANGPVPPVNYAGTLTMVNDKDYQGPYMNGNYNTVINGQQVGDVFEAQLASSQGGEQTASTPPAFSERGGRRRAGASQSPGSVRQVAGGVQVEFQDHKVDDVPRAGRRAPQRARRGSEHQREVRDSKRMVQLPEYDDRSDIQERERRRRLRPHYDFPRQGADGERQ